MRAVIDTNILLAGLLNVEGGAAKIIDRFKNGAFELILTHEVFTEYLEVIHCFDNDVPANKSEELMELIFEKSVKVTPVDSKGLCNDHSDEKFLDAALSGNAGFIVTKNKKHFPRNMEDVRIVNVKEFLTELEKVGDLS